MHPSEWEIPPLPWWEVVKITHTTTCIFEKFCRHFFMQLDAASSCWALCNISVSFQAEKNWAPDAHGHLRVTPITLTKNLPCLTHCLGCSGTYPCTADQWPQQLWLTGIRNIWGKVKNTSFLAWVGPIWFMPEWFCAWAGQTENLFSQNTVETQLLSHEHDRPTVMLLQNWLNVLEPFRLLPQLEVLMADVFSIQQPRGQVMAPCTSSSPPAWVQGKRGRKRPD